MKTKSDACTIDLLSTLVSSIVIVSVLQVVASRTIVILEDSRGIIFDRGIMAMTPTPELSFRPSHIDYCDETFKKNVR